MWGTEMEDGVAESVGRLSERNAKERLRESAALKAQHIDRELTIISEGVEYLANRMTMLLSAPGQYPPRTLPNTRADVSILSGMPYIHYSPGISDEDIASLAEETGAVSNFADTLALMSESYAVGRAYFYAASRKGYMLWLHINPDGQGNVLPDGEAREEMLSDSDPRERPWYKASAQATGVAFSKPYLGIDGHLNIECVAPYADAEGFAGVAGIGFDVEEVYRQMAHALADDSGVNFVLDDGGDVVLSSLPSGILAAVPGVADIRETGDKDLAAAARRMTAGESGVASVTVDGETYYLAFAPMKTLGWSFGTLIKKETAMEPVREARENVFVSMSGSQTILKNIFAGAKRNATLAFVIAAVFLAFASAKLATRITKPIRRLTEGVREISGGNLEYKLDLKTGDEIELLADSFNKMTDNLSEYMKNLERTATEKEHIKTEMDLARNIQDGMLPKDFPKQREFDIFATMHPAKAVGGDFYDFYFLDENHLAVTVADVSDKGVPAALFMVITKTLLKDNAIRVREPEKLSNAVEQANDALIASNQEGMFVTAFCGVLDIRTGTFRYANAGHNPPLIRRGTESAYLPNGESLMLGVMEGEAYPAKTITLAPGDVLFLYTDGVTEAMDENREMFRESRLKETLDAALPTATAEDMVGAVWKALQDFTADVEQSDDVTMLALVYHGDK
ncbi:MAG: SpoIIE family protein phosphatase [Schwartzia sp.]|nr:SpoIIE family protein phosphatase [Schwartzia sp. (in: firmicutes)]